MSLKSSTFPLNTRRGGVAGQAAKAKQRLLNRHHVAIEKVLADAKSYSEEYRRTLGAILDKGLRDSAKR
jgi:hypothetical protein